MLGQHDMRPLLPSRFDSAMRGSGAPSLDSQRSLRARTDA